MALYFSINHEYCKSMKKIILILVSVFSIQVAFSQNIDSDKLDRLFDVLVENDKAMGSVAVSKNGQIIYQRAFGFADLDAKKTASLETRYRVGSISKTFTSVLIFKAIDEKKLSLDQKIVEFFPEIENASNITLSQLLNHRSGIFSFTNRPDYLSWNTEPKTREELYQMIVNGGSLFAPDSKAEYSNSNYVLLTWILEDVYRESYRDLLNKDIIQPLGLGNTYVGNKPKGDTKEASSYKYLGKWEKETVTDMSIPLGAGAVVSTPEDLTIFIRSLFEGKLISPESLKGMTTIVDNYGRGFFQYPFFEAYAFGHDGGIDGFRSSFSFFPEEGVAYALTLNGLNFDANQISISVLSAVFGKEFEIPSFNIPSLSSEELDQYVGIYGNPSFPVEITIRKVNSTLIGQGTGQPEFVLDHQNGHVFVFNPAGLSLEFLPESREMILNQGGMKFTLNKK
jgi:D-alanyl-D-alanine carboxypeptidase